MGVGSIESCPDARHVIDTYSMSSEYITEKYKRKTITVMELTWRSPSQGFQTTHKNEVFWVKML